MADIDESAETLTDTAASRGHASILRVIVGGSVGAGKSTLIDRMLLGAGHFPDVADEAIREDTGIGGGEGRTAGGPSFLTSPLRKFAIGDTPGNSRHAHDIVAAASKADVAVVVVDAREGLVDEARFHSHIASQAGIRHIVLAVNKMDLVGFSKDVFDAIVAGYRAFASNLRFDTVVSIPVSARSGDNVTELSGRISWHSGSTLMGALENVPGPDSGAKRPFRFPVQRVDRLDGDSRGYAGSVASGSVRAGDAVAVAATGRNTTVLRILVGGREVPETSAGDEAMLVLADQLDISRGDLLCPPGSRPEVADQFTATLIWFDQHPLIPGRPYLLRTATRQVGASVTDLKYRLDVNSFAHVAAKSLEANCIGVCNLSTQAPLAFDRYADNRVTGAFELVDRVTDAVVGTGMIEHSLRRATNVHWQALDIDKATRAGQKGQKSAVLWFTGLSGSGKSTIANILERRLFAAGRHTYILDGDNVRHGLNRDLGFTEADRVENIRRVAEVARLMADAGLIVLVSFISPFRAERRLARELLAQGEFVEIFVDTPFDECARRDPKGLYARALKGEIKNFTGVDSPYEPPESPEIHLRASESEPGDLAVEIERWLWRQDIIPTDDDDVRN